MSKMIKRKVMQMSNSSFIVTLPKDWADFQNIVKGDSIEMDSSGNDLIIKGKKEKELEVKLNLEGMSLDLIWRHMVCSYRKGANRVIVKYGGNRETLDLIMQFTKDLMGWAIIKQDDEKVIIRDIIPLENTDLDVTFKRVFSLVLSLSEEVYQGFEKQDKKMLDSIPHLDFNINKFTNLCLRILNLRGNNYLKTNSMYKIISTLEEIGDEYRKLAIFYTPSKLSKDISELFVDVNSLLKKYYDMFYSYDEKKLKSFYEDSEELLKKFKKFKSNSLVDTRTFATLFTIFHMTKSLSEENLVLSL